MRCERSAAASQRRPPSRDLGEHLDREGGDPVGHGGKEPVVARVEGLDLVSVDIDLADHFAGDPERDHDLGPGIEETRQVLGGGAHIVDQDGAAFPGRPPADPSSDRYRHVLGRLGAGPGPESECRPVSEIDPDPPIVPEFMAEESTDLGDRLEAAQVAEDGVDLKQGRRALGRADGDRTSLSPEGQGSAEGENFRRVGSADDGV